MSNSLNSNGLINAIAGNSQLTILDFVEQLARQSSVGTLSAGNTYVGTVTGAKRNAKPFIVGFIIPDVPINFIPITESKKQVGEVTSSSGTSGVSGGPSFSPIAVGGVPSSTGQPLTPGLQTKVSSSFSPRDFRNGLIAAYTAKLGHPPTEAQLSLIYAQCILETGGGAGGLYNYNYGNVHAGGGTAKYVNNDPKQGIIGGPPPEPTGGSYYLTTDSENGVPYACYMRAYPSATDGARGQIDALFGNWPKTATSSTPEEFNDALKPGPGHDYYTAPKEVYLSGLRAQQMAYYKQFGLGDPTTTGDGGITLSGGAVSTSSIKTAIMTSSNVTDPVADDPLSGPLGRNIAPDAQRLDIVQKQIEALKEQIETMRATPPLMLLLNPQDFERSYERIADSSAKGRQGHIVHLWTENPLSISCKGMTAAQYAVDAEGSGGLTGANRVYSLSYKNLMSLVMIYRNNGMIFTGQNDFYVEKGSDGIGLIPASVFIYYDGHVYIGSFDDFSIDDSGDKPFNLEYSFKFKARYDIEVSVDTDLADKLTTVI